MNQFVKVTSSLLGSFVGGFLLSSTFTFSKAQRGKKIQSNADKMFFGIKKK